MNDQDSFYFKTESDAFINGILLEAKPAAAADTV